MKSEDLLTALDYLPDEMIEKSAEGRQRDSKAKVTVLTRFLKPALAVASVALIFGASIFAMSRFHINTADEAAPEKDPSDTANEVCPDKEDFSWQFSDVADDAETHYSINNSDMTATETEASNVGIESGSPAVNESLIVNISFTDGGIALKNVSGAILSHIDLREHTDSLQISVGGITLNRSEKNIEVMHTLLSLMEKSPVISPDSLTESEDIRMATLHFYISDGYSPTADSVHEPIKAAIELLYSGYVKISVNEFAPIYVSVGKEALEEFTNNLEYIVINE